MDGSGEKNYFNLTIGDQVYCLNNVSIEAVNMSQDFCDRFFASEHAQNFTLANDHYDIDRGIGDGNNLLWLPSAVTPMTVDMPNDFYEFPYVQINANMTACDANVLQLSVEEGLQFLNILHQGQLHGPNVDYNDTNEDVDARKTKTNDDAEEVIFVKEYSLPKTDAKVDRNGNKNAKEPRRNPKRRVQLQKASYDLALKLINADGTKKETARNHHQHHLQETRRSATTGSSINGSFKRPEVYARRTRTRRIVNNGHCKKKPMAKRPDAIVDREMIDDVGKSMVSIVEHVASVKSGEFVDRSYLDDLKVVLTQTCRLYSAMNGGIGEITIPN